MGVKFRTRYTVVSRKVVSRVVIFSDETFPQKDVVNGRPNV